MNHDVKVKQILNIDDETLVRMLIKQMRFHIHSYNLKDREKNLVKAESALKELFNCK